MLTRHRTYALGWLLLLLLIVGVVWYGYPRLKQHGQALGVLAGVNQSIDTLGKDLKDSQTRIADFVKQQDEWKGQLARLRQETQSRLDAARRQTQRATDELTSRLQVQMDGRLQDVQARVAVLESDRESAGVRVAELQRQLADLRRDMARNGDSLTAVRKQVEEEGASRERQLADLDVGQQTARRKLDAMEAKAAVRRVDFEVTKSHSRQLAPGISIGLTGTDVATRRVNGWMWVLPDRRTIWLRGQGAQVPLVFYGNEDGKKRELVITSVGKNSIAGYLLLPREAGGAPAEATGGNE
jgi:TolA-binding protein